MTDKIDTGPITPREPIPPSPFAKPRPAPKAKPAKAAKAKRRPAPKPKRETAFERAARIGKEEARARRKRGEPKPKAPPGTMDAMLEEFERCRALTDDEFEAELIWGEDAPDDDD